MISTIDSRNDISDAYEMELRKLITENVKLRFFLERLLHLEVANETRHDLEWFGMLIV